MLSREVWGKMRGNTSIGGAPVATRNIYAESRISFPSWISKGNKFDHPSEICLAFGQLLISRDSPRPPDSSSKLCKKRVKASPAIPFPRLIFMVSMEVINDLTDDEVDDTSLRRMVIPGGNMLVVVCDRLALYVCQLRQGDLRWPHTTTAQCDTPVRRERMDVWVWIPGSLFPFCCGQAGKDSQIIKRAEVESCCR